MPSGAGEQEPAGSQTAGCLTGCGHSPADQRGVWGLGFAVVALWLLPAFLQQDGAAGPGSYILAPGEGRARHPPLLWLAAARRVCCSSWPE